MTVEIPPVLGGPVLQWELIRACRRWPTVAITFGYLLWLLVQLFLFVADSYPHPEIIAVTQPWQPWWNVSRFDPRREALEQGRAKIVAQTTAASKHLATLLQQQLLLLVLLTPGVAAGALGQEKERDTLPALFGTELTSREIVTGKLLGRLAVLLRILVAGLPMLVALAILGDMPLGRLLLACLQAAVLTFGLASLCMLAAVWTRRTSDAILACYATLIILYLVRTVVLASFRVPVWLDPQEILTQLLAPEAALAPLSVVLHLMLWGIAGIVGLKLAAVGLRPACLGQWEARPQRWLWALRPAVGNDPVRWRERYVIGLAPLPWLRIVPGWMGMLGVLTFSGILAYSALDHLAGPGFTGYLRQGEWEIVQRMLRSMPTSRVSEELAIMGVALLVIGTLAVGVRCANSIAEEKRRKTWEDLILTPLSMDEIVRGKQWGVLQSIPPYLAMYALPMFALGALAGAPGVQTAAAWVTGGCVLFFVAAWLGMKVSAASQESEEVLEDIRAIVRRAIRREPALVARKDGTAIQARPSLPDPRVRP